MNQSDIEPARVAQSRQLCLLLYYALLLYFGVNSFMALGFSLAMPVIWLLQILPLLIFLPGMLSGRARSHAWLSFVILLYFVHGVLLAFSAERRWLGITEVILCSLLFIGLIVHIRRYRDHYQTPL